MSDPLALLELENQELLLKFNKGAALGVKHKERLLTNIRAMKVPNQLIQLRVDNVIKSVNDLPTKEESHV